MQVEISSLGRFLYLVVCVCDLHIRPYGSQLVRPSIRLDHSSYLLGYNGNALRETRSTLFAALHHCILLATFESTSNIV